MKKIPTFHIHKSIPKAQKVQQIVQSVRTHGHNCPCCGGVKAPVQSVKPVQGKENFSVIRGSSEVQLSQNIDRLNAINRSRKYAQKPTFKTSAVGGNPNTDYAFEMATSSIRFGFGATREVGSDLKDLGAKNVGVFVDPNLYKLKSGPVQTVLQSLQDHAVKYTVYSAIEIEPTERSFKDAITFAQTHKFDAFVAVGGGSTIDTCKAANLYSTYPADFLDYVNPPIGKGVPIPGPLKPLIAIPTSAGTGSEATGVAVFDFEAIGAKTGIAHRRLKPTLGIVDPENTRTLPPGVVAASGFDVLCHALESYTALPYSDRSPRPPTPLQRPAYQGANPISDVWSLHALDLVSKWLPVAYDDPSNDEARGHVMLAASFAGIGFGNAGVHLCHGMSYPVSSLVRDYIPEGYARTPLIPHGMSVVLHAPAVFRFTAEANPERHLHAAKVMGADTSKASSSDAGKLLVEQVLKLMKKMKVPNGLTAVGYTEADIPNLVKGTLPQHRVTKLSPRPVGEEELAMLFRDSMKIY